MGDRDIAGEDMVPELARLDHQAGIALLDRAADTGLLTSLGGGYYQIHPALPWYFTALFTATYGLPGDPPARRADRAYARAVGELGHYYHSESEEGRTAEILFAVQAEEANLLHALDLARAAGLWDAAVGCLHGLRVLYAGPDGTVSGPVGSGHHPGRHRPRHQRPATRSRGTMEHRHRIPDAARESCAGLVSRHHSAERQYHLDPDRSAPRWPLRRPA